MSNNTQPNSNQPLPKEGEGKVCIITGADTGMGLEETRAVAEAGYHVIMACYCPKKAAPVCEQLIAETGNPNIEVIGIDLANLSSVRAFADTVKARFAANGEQTAWGNHAAPTAAEADETAPNAPATGAAAPNATAAEAAASTAAEADETATNAPKDGADAPLALLMNNAGTIETELHITVDGLERTVSVNYVGPYLLTRLLLPLMGRGSRIVNMSSLVFPWGSLDFPDFFTRGRKGSFWRIPIYDNTKLAITLFTFDLAERLRDRGITVNAADPGIVSTNIIRMQMFFDPITDLIFRPIIRTPRQGADTAIHLLLDADKAEQTGTFNRSNHIHPVRDKFTHHRKMAQLWEETEKIVAPFLDSLDL